MIVKFIKNFLSMLTTIAMLTIVMFLVYLTAIEINSFTGSNEITLASVVVLFIAIGALITTITEG